MVFCAACAKVMLIFLFLFFRLNLVVVKKTNWAAELNLYFLDYGITVGGFEPSSKDHFIDLASS